MCTIKVTFCAVIVLLLCLFFIVLSPVYASHRVQYSTRVPAGYKVSDIHLTFAGTGGSLKDPKVYPKGTVTITSGNTVEVVWNPPLSNQESFSIHFSTDFIPLSVGDGKWTTGKGKKIRGGTILEGEAFYFGLVSTDPNLAYPLYRWGDAKWGFWFPKLDEGRYKSQKCYIGLPFETNEDVTLRLVCDDQLLVNGQKETELFFEQGQWDVIQSVDLIAVDDSNLETLHVGFIDFEIFTEDPNYAEIQLPRATILIDDNECGVEGFLAEDLNADCMIDMADFVMLARRWLFCYHPQPVACYENKFCCSVTVYRL